MTAINPWTKTILEWWEEPPYNVWEHNWQCGFCGHPTTSPYSILGMLGDWTAGCIQCAHELKNVEIIRKSIGSGSHYIWRPKHCHGQVECCEDCLQGVVDNE